MVPQGVNEDGRSMRTMSAGDFDNFDAIQRAAYRPMFIESKVVFLAHVALCPAGCWIVEENCQPIAYLICHPWTMGHPVPLNDEETRAPTRVDCLYLHSLTISPKHQRQGIGRRLWSKAQDTAAELGYSQFALVSVQGSQEFWKAVGFCEQAVLGVSSQRQLASYGPGARYMVRLN
jgi:ribosomal protein S18 acetylase RimI-like enzyme